MEVRGTVQGQRVELETPVPSLDGKRVRVHLDLLEDHRTLSSTEQAEIWREWVESGPQGPIEDDSDDWP